MDPNENKQINVGIRLATMLLDHFLMTMIAMVFVFPSLFSELSQSLTVSHDQPNLDILGGPFAYIGMFGFALYFCKDNINGRSIAKRILKLQVVDNKTGEVASPLKCFIRNLLCVLWPIEVIVAMVNPNRRLGDRLAGTRLVKFDPSLDQPKLNIGKALIPVAIAYGLLLLLLQSVPGMRITGTNYSETSYNQSESKALEQLLNDRLSSDITADIRIYDTIKNENLKYLSIILKIKKNFLDDNSLFMPINQEAERLIYSQFPKETFRGQLKFVYQRPGQLQSRSTVIGTIIQLKGH